MRYLRSGQILLLITCGIPFAAWSQGGRAGRAAAAAATPGAAGTPATPGAAAGGRGGRGGGGAVAATSEFYNFDPTATGGPPISDTQQVTHQKITLNGSALAYTALAGYIPLHNATTGQTEAHVFFTSYSKDGVAEGSSRPVLFFMGGAPGVSSAWQEFGGLGPKRMKWTTDGTAGMPPYSWVDNPNTLLGDTDLVFVNPVGTGFSRPDQPNRGPNFWNTAADIASLGEFVRSYVSLYSRQNAPLFLAGEDHGTGRVAGLAAYLTEHDIPVSGVVLLSMTSTADATAGDEQYMTLLPSLIMSSWYHKKLSPELTAMSAEQILGQARQFASREYLHALYKGDRMTAEERTKAVAGIARLTGLSKSFISNNDLRITVERFVTELMREQHRAISLTDSRVGGFEASAGGGRGGGGGRGFGGGAPALDFNMSKLSMGFQTAYDSYLRHELTFLGAKDGIFYLSNGGVGAFTATGNDDASLAGAFARNPNMRLFVGINLYDLSAPFYATEFTLAHLNVAPEVRAHNITVSHFEAGQMAYVDNKALTKLHADLSRFVTDAVAPAAK